MRQWGGKGRGSRAAHPAPGTHPATGVGEGGGYSWCQPPSRVAVGKTVRKDKTRPPASRLLQLPPQGGAVLWALCVFSFICDLSVPTPGVFSRLDEVPRLRRRKLILSSCCRGGTRRVHSEMPSLPGAPAQHSPADTYVSVPSPRGHAMSLPGSAWSLAHSWCLINVCRWDEIWV